MLALVLDGGNGYAQRRFMQNAADAASLSGATALLNGEYRDAVIRQKVLQYAQANGSTTATMTYEDANGNAIADPTNGIVPANAVGVRVTAQRTFPTYFARLLGMPTMTASAQATAGGVAAAQPSSFPGLTPLSVPTNFYEVCAGTQASCNIWDPQFAKIWGIKANQYKSLLDLSDGGGGNVNTNIRNWTQYGYDGAINADTWLPTVSGDHGSNVASSLRQRITDHPAGIDPDGVVWGTIDMIIWDAYDHATGKVHTALFGRFKVRMTGIYSSSTYGHFMNYIVPGHERDNTGGSDPLAGPKIVVFSR
jgi:hypothetical protein